MSNPLNEVDLTAPDAAVRLREMITKHSPVKVNVQRAFVATLPPEQHRAFYDTVDAHQITERLQGAYAALKALGVSPRKPDEVAVLEEKVRNQAVTIQNLQAALEREKAKVRTVAAGKDAQVEMLKDRLERAAPRPPELPTPAPAPAAEDWDYKALERRRPKRDEVVTDAAPFGVEVVARQVEDFVRRNGKCSKTDVSAAFPQSRAFLSAAYRHLHASRRVHVDGWQLQPWPNP